MKYIPLFLLLSSSAFAAITNNVPVAYQVDCNGPEATALVTALKNAGAVLNDDGMRQSLAIRPLRVMTYSNVNYDPTDPLYNKMTYAVSFTDHHGDWSGQSDVSVDESSNPNGIKAKAVVQALDTLNTNGTGDCAMGGKCGYLAADIDCNTDDKTHASECTVTLTDDLMVEN